MSVDEAKEMIAKYFNTYVGVRAWLDRSRYSGIRNGFTRTMSNRIRFFEFDRSNPRALGAVGREAMNTPIQGTSADITKIALYNVYLSTLDKPKIKVVNTIHDELVAECPPDLAEEAMYILKNEMEEAGKQFIHSVPVSADAGIAQSWAEK